jgi:hypothetical protein
MTLGTAKNQLILLRIAKGNPQKDNFHNLILVIDKKILS